MKDNKVRECNEYIDQRIRNKKDSTTESKAIFQEEIMLDDKDYVEMVENLLQKDFSSMSKIKNSLKKSLLESLQSQIIDGIDEDELDFEDLDKVAGGARRNQERLNKSKA